MKIFFVLKVKNFRGDMINVYKITSGMKGIGKTQLFIILFKTRTIDCQKMRVEVIFIQTTKAVVLHRTCAIIVGFSVKECCVQPNLALAEDLTRQSHDTEILKRF